MSDEAKMSAHENGTPLVSPGPAEPSPRSNPTAARTLEWLKATSPIAAAVAQIVAAIATVVLVWVTLSYVRLTADLVRLQDKYIHAQVEPCVDLVVPMTIPEIVVHNCGPDPVVDVTVDIEYTIRVSAAFDRALIEDHGYFGPAGRVTPGFGPEHTWEIAVLAPGEKKAFPAADHAKFAVLNAESTRKGYGVMKKNAAALRKQVGVPLETPPPPGPILFTPRVLVTARYRREADRKTFTVMKTVQASRVTTPKGEEFQFSPYTGP